MKTILIKDKKFTELFSENELNRIIIKCTDEIKLSITDPDNLVLIGVLNGGIPFMNTIAFSLPENITVDYVKAVSYGDNMYSSGEVRLLLDTQVDVRGKDVLIVDDIIDSGRTTKFLRDHFQLKGAKSVCLCCLFFKKNDQMSEPDFFGSYIGDDFIVGFGLDYAQKGRNLKNILKLSE